MELWWNVVVWSSLTGWAGFSLVLLSGWTWLAWRGA